MNLSYFLNNIEVSKLRFEVIYNPQTQFFQVRIAKDVDKNYNFKIQYLGKNNWKIWIDAISKYQAVEIGKRLIEICHMRVFDVM